MTSNQFLFSGATNIRQECSCIKFYTEVAKGANRWGSNLNASRARTSRASAHLCMHTHLHARWEKTTLYPSGAESALSGKQEENGIFSFLKKRRSSQGHAPLSQCCANYSLISQEGLRCSRSLQRARAIRRKDGRLIRPQWLMNKHKDFLSD